jgi:hypothetical protein
MKGVLQMPQSTIEDVQADGNSSDSDAGDDDDSSAAEVHAEEISGDPIESAGLVSTTEFSAPVEDDPSGDDNSDSDDSDEDEDADGDDADTELDKTFQDSKRFQELNQQKNDAVQEKLQAEAGYNALKDQVSTLTELVRGLGGNKQGTQAQDPGFQDVLQMTDESIIEGFESDPKGFLANFAKQVVAEAENRFEGKSKLTQQQIAKQNQEKAINDLYADYESKNPDFVDMWEKGSIQKFMEENPGNTPISAHRMMKSAELEESLKAGQEAEIKKAVEAAVKKATKNFKAKKSAKVISAGPGGGSQQATNGTPADLANTKEHGGLTSVLVQRSLAREKARNG